MMRTDDLIAALASRNEAIEPRAWRRPLMSALGWGVLGMVLLMAISLGVRSDLTEAMRLPMFWVKLAFPAALFAGALFAMARLARPGIRLGRVPVALAGLVLALWLLAAFVLFAAAPGEREMLLLGQSWRSCPLAIALLSGPLFLAALWALKGLAPTRTAWAGAAAGLLAGAGGALVYALHCVEMAAPFIAIWYVLGMLIPAAAGALLGPRLLHW